jgi:hypothetical protein
MQRPAEMDIVRRAYELWEQAGKPDGRDQEFYHQAEQELKNAIEQSILEQPRNRFGSVRADKSRHRFLTAIRNVIHLLGLQLILLPNSSEGSHVSSCQEAHVHRPRRRT